MARFPPGFIDDLKAQADIVQVIQDVVPLKQAGSTFKGLCPFHQEKTPSFHVNREKGFFHCFGCSTGGDVLKFVELHEKLSFPEAVQSLAQRFGLAVPESGDPERDREALVEREALLKVHELADAYFRAQLNGAAGTVARRYLEQRDMRPETVERLGLGYAPPRRDSLTTHLQDAGQPLDRLLRSGLVVQRDGGRPYDRFRNRLIIPIAREAGSVIAFGGRALATDQQPKYLNSPETPLYAKGRTLYGLHLTKQAVADVGYVVLVEGYFDFAQALQAGVKPVAATCGTALTDRHVRLLRRFCSRTLLSFDPDSAGEGAAARSGELLISQGFQVNVVQLPPGDDPDGFIRQHGGGAYRERLRTSRPYLDDVLDRAAAGRDLSRAQEKRALLDRMKPVAQAIQDKVVKDGFLDRVEHLAQVPEGMFRDELRQENKPRRAEVQADIRTAQTALLPAEKGLIWWMMRSTAAAQAVLASLEPADLEGVQTAHILQLARSLATVPAEGAPEALRERLDEDDVELVGAIEREAVPAADAEDCGIELRKRRYDREREALQAAIDRRQRDGSPAALDEIPDLWARKKDLLQRIEELAE
jgi:DNA primase